MTRPDQGLSSLALGGGERETLGTRLSKPNQLPKGCSYQRRPFLALCLKITVTSVLPQTQLGFKYNFDCPSLCFNILLIVYHLQFSPIKLAVERPWPHHYNQDSLLIPMYLTNQVESWLNLMKIINFLLQHSRIHV